MPHLIEGLPDSLSQEIGCPTGVETSLLTIYEDADCGSTFMLFLVLGIYFATWGEVEMMFTELTSALRAAKGK